MNETLRLDGDRFDGDTRHPTPSGVWQSNTVLYGPGPQTVHTGRQPGTQIATVLLVDDDFTTVDIFSQVLRLEGYAVRTALSAEDGMQAVHQSDPDAILVDSNLPLANGVEFVRRLRACEGHRETPVAIVTGDYSFDNTLLHQLDATVAFKPLFVAELVDLTRRLLAGRNSIQDVSLPTRT